MKMTLTVLLYKLWSLLKFQNSRNHLNCHENSAYRWKLLSAEATAGSNSDATTTQLLPGVPRQD